MNKKYLPEGYKAEFSDFDRHPTSISAVMEAMTTKEILEASAISCDSYHNLIVDLGGAKGIIPRNEGAIGIAEGNVRDIALISRVGKRVCFTVTDTFLENGKTVFKLSRKDAQKRCTDYYISTLKAGDIIPAKITHMESFGAFCDIGCGCVALLPIDTISVSRISHPKDRFKCGDDIKAVVKSIDSDGKITLSIKELLGTWEENAALFSQGETVSGIVRSVEDYGIFIELTPNLAGLAEIRPNVSVGQTASVYIKSMLPDKMKVKLIIIDNFSADYSKDKLNYFTTDGHIDSWQYSPDSCNRIIKTEFN